MCLAYYVLCLLSKLKEVVKYLLSNVVDSNPLDIKFAWKNSSRSPLTSTRNLLRQTFLCIVIKRFKSSFHEGVVYINRSEKGCSWKLLTFSDIFSYFHCSSIFMNTFIWFFHISMTTYFIKAWIIKTTWSSYLMSWK